MRTRPFGFRYKGIVFSCQGLFRNFTQYSGQSFHNPTISCGYKALAPSGIIQWGRPFALFSFNISLRKNSFCGHSRGFLPGLTDEKVFVLRYRLNICRSWINVSKQPMGSMIKSSFPLLRVLVAAGWSLLCILIIGAPILASRAHYTPASFIYLLFSNVCHQMPDRSFIFAGFPFAVCHRCSGIYLGLMLGTLFKNPLLKHSPGIRRAWVLASIVPLLIDVLLPLAGLWTGSTTGRFLTGLLFGIMLSGLLFQGIVELLANPQQRLHLRGGVK
jgi:uncharacterized membrane protein